MKKIFYSLKDIIISYLILYLSVVIFITGYLIICNNMELLNNPYSLEKCIIISMTVSMIPLTIYLIKRNYQKECLLDLKSLILMIPLGGSISLFYNMLTINLQDNKNIMELSLPILIIYTAILGPLFEEILFRYTALRKTKTVMREKYAIIFISLVFALLHKGIINITYAFILGLILSFVYKKGKNIFYPILFHMSANFTSIFIKKYYLSLLIISICVFVITVIILNRNKKWYFKFK